MILTKEIVEKNVLQDYYSNNIDNEIQKNDRLGKLNFIESCNFERLGIVHIEMNCFSSLVNLKKIDLSRNQIQTLEWTHSLKYLEYLSLYHNQIKSLSDIKLLFSIESLRDLDLRLNPVSKTSTYRRDVIACLPYLHRLDGRDIRVMEREKASGSTVSAEESDNLSDDSLDIPISKESGKILPHQDEALDSSIKSVLCTAVIDNDVTTRREQNEWNPVRNEILNFISNVLMECRKTQTPEAKSIEELEKRLQQMSRQMESLQYFNKTLKQESEEWKQKYVQEKIRYDEERAQWKESIALLKEAQESLIQMNQYLHIQLKQSEHKYTEESNQWQENFNELYDLYNQCNLERKKE